MVKLNSARTLVDKLLTETENVGDVSNNELTESKNLEKFTLGQEELMANDNGHYALVDTKGVKAVFLNCSISIQMGTLIIYQMKKGKNVPIFVVPPGLYTCVYRCDENGNPDYVTKTL